MSLAGGKVIFRDGQAFVADISSAQEPQPVGSMDEVIRRVGAAVGSSPAQTDAAIAAMSAPPSTPHPSQTPTAVLIALGAVLLIAGSAIAGLRQAFRA